MKILIFILIFILVLYVYSRFLEQSALYYPDEAMELTPQDQGLEYEDVDFFTADGIKINGWYIPKSGASQTILFCHGNGGNISHRLDKIKFFHELGVNMFIFDYRGYGKSQGKHSEKGFYADADAAYKYIISREDSKSIILYGESLGGAVAVDLAARQKVDVLILEGTFTNIYDMAKVIYPFLPKIFLKTKFDSLAKIKSVNARIFSMHSKVDDIVPFSLGKELYDAAPGKKEFLELYGTHNDSFFISQKSIKEKLSAFLLSLRS